MSDWLRDGIWEFIGVVLSLVAIFIAVWSLLNGRKKKFLVYKIMTVKTLLKNTGVGDLIITRRTGELVNDIYQIIIKIFNAGNVPILPSDFVKPLAFHFDKSVQILTVKILRISPSLTVSFQYAENSISFKPMLLNPQESFWIELLVSSYPEKILHEAHIVGVKEIKKVESKNNVWYKERRLLSKLALSIILVIGVFIMLMSFPIFVSPVERPLFVILGFFIVACVIFLARLLSANKYVF